MFDIQDSKNVRLVGNKTSGEKMLVGKNLPGLVAENNEAGSGKSLPNVNQPTQSSSATRLFRHFTRHPVWSAVVAGLILLAIGGALRYAFPVVKGYLS